MKFPVLVTAFCLVTLAACSKGGHVEEPPAPEAPTPVIPTPTPSIANVNKIYFGGDAKISGTSGATTYNISIGLSPVEGKTLTGGSHHLILGTPNQQVQQ